MSYCSMCFSFTLLYKNTTPRQEVFALFFYFFISVDTRRESRYKINGRGLVLSSSQNESLSVEDRPVLFLDANSRQRRLFMSDYIVLQVTQSPTIDKEVSAFEKHSYAWLCFCQHARHALEIGAFNRDTIKLQFKEFYASLGGE